MIASGVRYAAELNEAFATFRVSPALLQGMMDFDGGLLTLPAAAQTYAKQEADASGDASASNDLGVTHPRSNIMAAAWWLAEVSDMKGSDWNSVVHFYGDGPVARMKVTKIKAGPYERRRKQWQ